MTASFAPKDLSQLDHAALSRLLARRIESVGGAPYASDKERYAVLVGDDSGEVVELGRPLRGNRLFPTKALSRNIALLNDLEAFAATQDTKNWRYWELKITGTKAASEILASELVRFNKKINNIFTQIRKHHKFDLILLTIHVRYDEFSGLFDIHAHLICDVPHEDLEPVRIRLMQAFSICDTPDDPIRNLAAVITYSLWGVYRPDEALTWPDSALKAVWGLHSGKSRPHLVRTGKTFQNWRKARNDSPEREKLAADRRRRRENRAETRDPRGRPQTGDKLLAKVAIRLRGEKTVALIVEKGAAPARPVTSSSSTVATTQPPHDAGVATPTFRPTTNPDEPDAECESPVLPANDNPLASAPLDESDVETVRLRPMDKDVSPLRIPARKHWWFKAWPSWLQADPCKPRPIQRRLW